MRLVARPVCAIRGCRPERIGTRPPNWTDPPGWPLIHYRCIRCQVEWWG